MSNHQVIRNGTGPLHIAEQNSIDWWALCGNHYTGPDIKVWRKGSQAVAIWNIWRHCGRCERRDRELRGL